MNSIERVKLYRDNEALSQSDLKQLIYPKAYKEESLQMIKGNYVDMVLTMPDMNVKDFFTTCNIDRPSDNIINICDNLLKAEFVNLDTISEQDYEVFLKGYYDNRNINGKIESFKKAAKQWFDFKVENSNKFILTDKELESLDQAIFNCKQSNIWKNISRLDHKFQYDFYWGMNGIIAKGLADIIIETPNEVYEIDIKYTDAKTIESWMYIMKSLHYYIQKAYYKEGLEICKNKTVKSSWLVISPNFTKLLEVPDLFMKWGKHGYIQEYGLIDPNTFKRYYPGYEKAIEIYINQSFKDEQTQYTGEDVLNLLFNVNFDVDNPEQ